MKELYSKDPIERAIAQKAIRVLDNPTLSETQKMQWIRVLQNKLLEYQTQQKTKTPPQSITTKSAPLCVGDGVKQARLLTFKATEAKKEQRTPLTPPKKKQVVRCLITGTLQLKTKP